MRAEWRFKAAGFCGWLAVAVPTFVDIHSGRLAGTAALGWMVAFLTFGATYAFHLRPVAATRPHRVMSLVALSILAAAGTLMVITSAGLMKYLASVTLTIVAGELPYVVSSRFVWAWVAAQSAVLGTVFWLSFGWVSGVAGGFAYAGLQVLALGRALMELRERQARQQLARVVAELRGTQALLSENSRVAERLRISRDLHDSMGHHLTALSLQLDVAARQLDGPDARRVHEAHAITKLLLADVRNVVGDLRAGAAIDVAGANRGPGLLRGRTTSAHRRAGCPIDRNTRSSQHTAAVRAGNRHQRSAPRQRTQCLDPCRAHCRRHRASGP